MQNRRLDYDKKYPDNAFWLTLFFVSNGAQCDTKIGKKKYAKEQKFYDAKSYDFKGVEVNKASLDKIQAIEMDDPSIDSDAILGMSEEENLSW